MNEYDFNEKGYIFLKSVFTNKDIEDFSNEIKTFMNENNIYGLLNKKEDENMGTFYVNNTYSLLNNYHKIQHYYLPVIDNKGTRDRKTDLGLIDIYNADKLFPNISNYFDSNLIQILLSKITGTNWKLLRTNIQISNNVSSPNSFHFENINNKCIKFCIYLSDIVDNNGALVYIEKTHEIKNEIKNEYIKTFNGNRGDVLISYQNGFHRKMPQKNTVSAFLIFNFVEK